MSHPMRLRGTAVIVWLVIAPGALGSIAEVIAGENDVLFKADLEYGLHENQRSGSFALTVNR